jgi:hypothetical protein
MNKFKKKKKLKKKSDTKFDAVAARYSKVHDDAMLHSTYDHDAHRG